MFTRTLLLGLALSLAPALANAGADDHGHDDDHHKTEAAGVEIIHGWARATTSGSTQIFLEMHNESGGEIVLHGAHMHDGGLEAVVMGAPVKAGDAPVMLGELPIAAGAEFALDPEGVYLALEGLQAPLAKGDTFELVLDLHPVGEVEIVIDVEAANATQHSHAGHMH